MTIILAGIALFVFVVGICMIAPTKKQEKKMAEKYKAWRE